MPAVRSYAPAGLVTTDPFGENAPPGDRSRGKPQSGKRNPRLPVGLAAGGAVTNEADGTERVHQKWLLAEAGGVGLGVSNRGQYGFDMLDGELRLNILRTQPYVLGRGGGYDDSRLMPFMGKGEHEASFRFHVGRAARLRRELPAEAYLLEKPAGTAAHSGRSGSATYPSATSAKR